MSGRGNLEGGVLPLEGHRHRQGLSSLRIVHAVLDLCVAAQVVRVGPRNGRWRYGVADRNLVAVAICDGRGARLLLHKSGGSDGRETAWYVVIEAIASSVAGDEPAAQVAERDSVVAIGDEDGARAVGCMPAPADSNNEIGRAHV